MTNKVTLEQIEQAINEYDSNAVTDLPSFGSATVGITPEGITVHKAEVVWGGYLDIWSPSFRYNIAFGETDNGWSYNDDQGFGYGDFINDLSTAKEIVEVFFKQVAENPQLTYEKAE